MTTRYATTHNHHSHEEESYFVSMTDMMVGLLFIFIIMLMYFALQYQSTTKRLTTAQETRKEIVAEIQDTLKREGVLNVTVDPRSEVIRLGDNALRFDPGSAVVDVQYDRIINALSSVLADILPCYSNERLFQINADKCGQRNQEQHWIEAIFIEGHTDNVPISTASYRSNWELSAARATNTYAAMVAKRPDLEELQNPEGQALLSVSGYGEKRPLSPDSNSTDEGRRANRRIDIRLIMATPQYEEAIQEIKAEIGQ